MNIKDENSHSTTQIRKKVLVVGATGFLGSKIVRSLALEKNLVVRAMSRRDAHADATAELEWVKGDMMDPVSLDAALLGVDVVIASANGYMKESIAADFVGNKNLIDAAARAKVKRFVFLSIVNCEAATDVPHFHAKKVTEDLLKSSGIPYVFIRAPAFLDQSTDYIADGVKAGRFYAMGDKTTKWSYVITDDLALYLAKAAAYPDEDINNNSIDIGWNDGPKSQEEIAKIVSAITKTKLSIWIVPWFIFNVLVYPLKLFSELGYDMAQMLLFFKKGSFVANTTKQERFFGPAPTSIEAITRWAESKKLKLHEARD